MTAPTSISLPSAPTAASAGGGSGTSSAESAPAFASALDDALVDGGSGQAPAGGTPGTSSAPAGADDTAPAADPADDQPTDVAPDAATLPGGSWAMLMAALGLGGPAPTPPPAEPSAQSTSPTQPALSGLGSVGALPAGSAPVASDVAGRALTAGVPAASETPAPAGSAVPAGIPATAVALPSTPTAVPPAPGTVDALAATTGLTALTAPTTPSFPGPSSTVGAPSTDSAPGTAGAVPLLLPVAGSTGDAADTAPGGNSGGGTSGGGTGTAALPVTAEADPVPDAVAPVGLGAPAPTAPAAAVGPATAATGQEPPVAAQLAPQLAVLRYSPDGTQTMTLVITPDSLGPVAVQVTVTDGTLDLTLHGASEHGRHALTEALPELRRDLESAGLTFSRLEVGADTGRNGGAGDRSAQQQLADLLGNGAQQRQPDARSRAWAPPSSHLAETGPVPTSHSSASSGVDIRV